MSLQKALSGEYSYQSDPKLALQYYKEYGFHIEKNFYTPEFCDRLIEQANQLTAARANNFKPALMPHKENKIFLEAMRYPKTVEILQYFMNGKPYGIQTQFFYCVPGTRGFSLHQDNFYIQANNDVFISVWVSLVDTYAENGGLAVYPGSHKEGNLPIRQLSLELDPNQDKNASNEETIVPDQYQAHHLSMKKGDALFIHSQLVHGSNKNNSQHCRYSSLNLYIKEGESFRSGNSARREVISLQEKDTIHE